MKKYGLIFNHKFLFCYDIFFIFFLQKGFRIFYFLIYRRMEIKKSTKIPPKYYCELCDYFTCYLKDYNKHLLTKKHMEKMEILRK
jgi:hypothetical protein